MDRTALLLLMLPIAYVTGSVPFGLLVGLSKGVDPRKAGSGNIGATNVGRLLGGRYFAIVFILDLLKGMLPMLAAAAMLRAPFRGEAMSVGDYALWIAVGFAAIFGHLFSCFLKFKGGKGVATSAGVMLGLFPYFTIPGLLAIFIWLSVFMPSRYVSLASIAGAGAFPLLYVGVGLLRGWPVFGEQWPLLAFSILVAVMIVWKHRSNIARLRAGTENRFVKKPKAA